MLKNWQTHHYSSNVKEGRESNAQSTGLNANIHVCSIVTVIGLTEASMVTKMHNDALYAVHKGILEMPWRVRVRRRQRRRVRSGGRHLCSRVEVRRRRGPETRYRLAPVSVPTCYRGPCPAKKEFSLNLPVIRYKTSSDCKAIKP